MNKKQELTHEVIKHMDDLLTKHRAAVREEYYKRGGALAWMRKHKKTTISDAILAEARERALAELRAYKSN